VRVPEEYTGKEQLLEMLNASLDRMAEGIAAASDEQLAEPSGPEEGAWPRSEFCRLAGVHLWYHSGQINYIQTMLGDDQWHWM
jgi:hypothetical protein